MENAFWGAVEDQDLESLSETLELRDERIQSSLGSVVPVLSEWRRRRRESSLVDGWRYRISWTPVPAAAGPPVLSGTWLLLAPSAGADEELVTGCQEACADAGAQIRRLSVPDSAVADRSALTALLSAEIGEGDLPTGVISLLGMDERPHPEGPSYGVAATVTLVQSLADLGADTYASESGAHGVRLWCLTRGAVATADNDPSLSMTQAQIWGLGRVAALEHPDVWGGLIDLPDGVDERDWRCVVAALAPGQVRVDDAPREDQVAVRDGHGRARRLARAPLGSAEPVRSWMPRDTVLITGGTGALGSRVARWAAEAGAEHLVLVSRQGMEAPGAHELVADLETFGAQVTVAACDVSDYQALGEVVALTRASCPPIRAVFHTAGSGRPAALTETDLAEVAEVLSAKVAGARHLDALFADPPNDANELNQPSETGKAADSPGLSLDAFVLFSSVAGMWGSGGQAAYAAANASLDALALSRRARGLTATSIAWGPWAEGGMATPEDVKRRLSGQGLTALAPEPALAGLRQALSHDETYVGVADVDWERFHSLFTLAGPSALMNDLPDVRALIAAQAADAAGDAGSEAGTRLGRQVAELSDAEANRHVLTLVRNEAAAVLGHTGREAVASHRAFKDLGFDSLTAMDLRTRLGTVTGLPLPATIAFDHPTPHALARYLMDQVSGERRPAGEHRAPSSAAVPTDDPVAIIGMACRYPGGVASPEDLWQLVLRGGDAVSGFPTDRGWDLAALYDPDPDRQGTSYTRHGGFLRDVGEFDADFFGISPREALAMDPQQRLLLETAWEALERSRIDPSGLAGSQTGVFVGASPSGYGVGAEETEGHALAGTAGGVVSGRIAYSLGLEGPAVTIDTACSSSLVALHLAAQSLRRGECSLALAGGVMVMPSAAGFIEFSRQRGLAVDGRCKAFSAQADGTGWAEGVGVLALERLSDAVRNGHRVLAVVRGSAVNQDGASNGLTAPNGPSQQRVIRQALASAGLTAADVDMVEAHGTGTTLGDPIEAQALLATYGQEREDGRPLWLGSVKSNIGHAAAAAGVAGVIKTVMAIQHGVMPKTLHVDEPSPYIDWSAGAVQLLTEPVEWKANGRPRGAGVSSFGMSGTNVHVIVAEPPAYPGRTEVDGPAANEGGFDAHEDTEAEPGLVAAGGLVPWVVSARSAAALAVQARRLRDFAEADSASDVTEIGWSLLTTRARHEHRGLVLARDRDGMLDALDALVRGEELPHALRGYARSGDRTVMVFPGQGSQWVGMARELLEDSEVFAGAVAACEEALSPYVEWSLGEVLREGGEESLRRVDVVQPVLFAVMVGLARLWESVGVVPDVVVGHSQGEIAAAHIAGGLSLEDAARVVALRSKALVALSGGGAMAQVALGEVEAAALVGSWEGRVVVAAVNGPASTVVSGEGAAVEELLARCESDGVWARRIDVDYASHGPQVEEIREELLQALSGISPVSSRISFHSTVTGEVTDTATLDAGYWVRNLREPVRFAPVIEALAQADTRVFIEVSPHPVLLAGVEDTVETCGGMADDAVPAVVDTLRRDEGGAARFLISVARAHAIGLPVDWACVFAGAPRQQVELPTYAFQHKRYWLEPVDYRGSLGAQAVAEDTAAGDFWRAVEEGDLDSLAAELHAAADVDRSSLAEVMPSLSAWRRLRREGSLLESRCYRETWVRLADRRANVTGTWLVVTPPVDASTGVDDAQVAACERALRLSGARVVRLEWDTARPPERTDWGQRLVAAAEGSVAGVVSMLGFDERPHPQVAHVSLGLVSTMVLVQALADADVDGPVWSLTHGAVTTGEEDPPPSAAQAQLWALGRVAALEYPRLWGGLIDLPEAMNDAAWEKATALLADPGEDQLAMRGDGVWGRRVERARPGVSRPGRDRWSPRGTVLVTGGTDPFGARVARWLVDEGARDLLLVSAEGLEAPGAVALQAALTDGGATVTVASCDVADRQALADLIAETERRGPEIRTVIHTATELELGELDGIGVEDIDANGRAKVPGAWNLDDIFGDSQLDAFVLFSSVSAFWGSRDHAAYAVANASLDALALRRRARGLAGTSVAWAVWDFFRDENARDEGDAARVAGTIESLKRQGLPALEPTTALTVLGHVIDCDDACLAVAEVDWDRFVPAFTSVRRSAFLDHLPEARRVMEAAAGEEPDAGTAAALRDRLVGLSETARRQALLDLVNTNVAAVLSHDASSTPDEGRSFRDLGFNSLTGMELRTRLSAATGLKLPATLVFDHPNASALVERLLGELFAEEAVDLTVVQRELDRFGTVISRAAEAGVRDREVASRLQELLDVWKGGHVAVDDGKSAAEQLEEASDEEMFAFIRDQLGKS
ncbi:type I polyketide synthase [Streptomyces aculeolatus]|nr:type I polyketide synthase [Streptomyces aculeolatus]